MNKKFCSGIVTLALLSMVIGILLAGCGKVVKSGDSREVSVEDTSTYSLPLPQPPSSLDANRRMEFIARHFWDSMDWQDTLRLNSDRFMGESMANYGSVLLSVEESKRGAMVVGMVNSLSSNQKALETVSDYAYKYFYYPGAPQYDAELYLLFVNPLLAQTDLNEAERVRLESRKIEILKNRKGRRAADFNFIDTDGKNRRFSSLFPDAEIRILMLYDPECNVCDEAVRLMSKEGDFSNAVKEHRVGVIAVNAYGQPQGGKAQRKAGMPSDWIVGYSPEGEIEEKEIYIIRATPTIYILNKEGTVIEKEITLDRLAEIVG